MPNDTQSIKVAQSGLWWLWLTAVAVLLDQISKLWIIKSVEIGERISVLPVFNITHVHNYGAAFSIFSDAGGSQVYGLSAIAIAVSSLLLWWLRKMPKSQKLLGMAYSLILGGAIGNLYDRLAYGYVEDFIHVFYQNYHFPAFNIADSAITLGAALMILDAFTGRKQDDEVPSDAH